MLTFSDPRLTAEFNDWPNGKHRVKCKFYIEQKPDKGYRVCRQTTDKNGQWCKPKMGTYGGAACIVTGSDGQTYILQQIPQYGGIKIMRHDFMDERVVFARRDEEFDTLNALITQAK